MTRLILFIALLIPLGVCARTIQFTPQDYDKASTCLALNVYHEARNQGYTGQLAVAAVTLNRTKSKHYPNTICKVVYFQRHAVCAFSWVCQGKRILWNNDIEVASWKHIKDLVDAWLYMADVNELRDPTNGALFYHTKDVKPAWENEVTHTVTIENHIFYQ